MCLWHRSSFRRPRASTALVSLGGLTRDLGRTLEGGVETVSIARLFLGESIYDFGGVPAGTAHTALALLLFPVELNELGIH